MLDFEEIAVLQVDVSLLLPGVNAVDIDCQTDLCVFEFISVVCTRPSNFVNEPVTVDITRCLILNKTSECSGSIVHVVVRTFAWVFVNFSILNLFVVVK